MAVKIEEKAEILSKKQCRRLEALKAAREVLTTKSVIGSEGLEPAPLVEIARYIIEGRDPMEPYHPRVLGHVEVRTRMDEEAGVAYFEAGDEDS